MERILSQRFSPSLAFRERFLAKEQGHADVTRDQVVSGARGIVYAPHFFESML